MTLTDTVSPREEIEDHEGNKINKKTKNLRTKLKNKINMKRIDRMTSVSYTHLTLPTICSV